MADASGLIDVNPQKALLADLPFDVDDFHASRACGAFGGIAYALQLHCMAGGRRASFPATKKWARAHSDMRPASTKVSIVADTHKSKPGKGSGSAHNRDQMRPEYQAGPNQRKTAEAPAATGLLQEAGLQIFARAGLARACNSYWPGFFGSRGRGGRLGSGSERLTGGGRGRAVRSGFKRDRSDRRGE